MATVRPARTSAPGRAVLAPPPAGYAPMRHPGRPHRWDRDSILSALRGWVAETGSPPRRQDWSGERADEAPPAQRKWMGEHPRWPSSSCVAAHFGSWSKALQAAGLSARCLTFEDSVADRVEETWRLATAGHTIREIANLLGVSVSSVHNYLRARTCPECGGPVPSPLAARCIACTAHVPTVQSPWTREAVRDAICAWTDENGRPPRYHEWTPSRAQPGRWEAESPRWPSAAVVCDVYRNHPDPWNAALADAGASIRFRRWSDDAIRSALAAYWTRTGRPLNADDLRAPDWNGPTASTLRRRYGSVERAWQALGPVPA
jgi:hypothetical protein